MQVLPTQFLSAEDEKAQYDLHENDVHDERYRAFLARTAEPLLTRLISPSHGLDFGCGPGPLLAEMMREAGHSVALYDAFYYPESAVFEQSYDFITATEVAEHLYDVRYWFDRLWCCLRANGWLAIQTRQAVSATDFPAWHYKNDPTHVSFFTPATFQWLALHWRAELTIISDEVVLFQRQS
ncbi:class I SAM-dependent methyltransferase [Salinispirillum marinum]|uniref:Class I SAM-dependent methyltransferase n=2 Tax=Saccharospirillaceae TaxID=255527 RepID=A0ABV8BFC5_9GAMM